MAGWLIGMFEIQAHCFHDACTATKTLIGWFLLQAHCFHDACTFTRTLIGWFDIQAHSLHPSTVIGWYEAYAHNFYDLSAKTLTGLYDLTTHCFSHVFKHNYQNFDQLGQWCLKQYGYEH